MRPMRGLSDRIKERLAALELSESEASVMAGHGKDFIRDIRRKGGSPSAENLAALANVLQCSVEWLLHDGADEDPSTGGVEPAAVAYLTARHKVFVIGEIRASTWFDIDAEPSATEVLAVDIDPDFPRARRFALKVVGQSINKVAEPGDYLIVADWADVGSSLRDEDIIVVRRETAGKFQYTVKVAKKGKKGWELWPKSYDSAHQGPIPFSDGDPNCEVTIVGLVVSMQRRLARRR